ncbi:FecR domain-containing protein [Devosia sp.]|uniref:FecR family protein n=1 Tax=Devosia sp. TaxID=1871048 RepID=UPI003266E959
MAITAAIGAGGDGTAVGVDPDASSGSRTLVVGDDISVGDRVVTGRSGQVQILFSDQTRLVVGPSSSLLIEQYLMRNDGSAEKLAIKALGGTFRFITGHSAKSAYQINTPTAAIAIRGTKFDFLVTGDQTLVMLYEGALTACAPGGKCVALNKRCELSQTSRSIARLYLRPDPERIPLSQNFLYARFQTRLLRDFRITGAGNCVVQQVEVQPQSLVHSSDFPTQQSRNSGTSTPPPTPTPTVRGKN